MINDDCRICLRANEHEDIDCLTCETRVSYALPILEHLLTDDNYITEDVCPN